MFSNSDWLVWLGMALFLGVIEAASVHFVFSMLAGGALAGAVAGALGAPLSVQVVVAVVVAAALLATVRPVAKRYFTVEGNAGIGSPAQIGRSALVLEVVTEQDGRVKLGGETWSARTRPGAAVCLPGQEVRVVSLQGATAIVSNIAEGQELE